MINMKNDFNLTFQKACCLDHLQCWNDGCEFFLLNKCRNKTTWIGNMVHDLQGGCFALDPPFCKICNNALFCVNICVARMYYVMHKQENFTQVAIHLSIHDHLVAEVVLEKLSIKSNP